MIYILRKQHGLIVAKSKGKIIGRRKGEMIYNVKLRKYQRKIMKDYKSGMSINAIAIKYHVTWVTAKRFITIYAKMKKPAPLTEKPQKHGHPLMQNWNILKHTCNLKYKKKIKFI